MGLFHKLSVLIKRTFSAKPFPKVDSMRKYGDNAEDDFEQRIVRLIPDIEYKRNVFVDASTGKCEIDFLINYQNKLFIVEIKHLKGILREDSSGNLIKYKQDKYSYDIHEKDVKNPFKQVNRQASLLKEMTHSYPWINTIVYFCDTNGVVLQSDGTWFKNVNDVANYIKNAGIESYREEISKCFSRCKSSDCVIGKYSGTAIRCNVSDSSLSFCGYKKKDIKALDIEHYFTHDVVYVCLKNGMVVTCKNEIGELVFENIDATDKSDCCSISKIEEVIFGE